ncbi:MAG: carboxypeptidase-like regulatory domain-containing protein [Bryobacteraceae bacterium]
MRIKLFLLLIALTPLFAQYETADVLGTVKDARSSVIPKATVTLINQETGIQSKATSDENGNYLFSQVKIGKYTVTAEAAGFSKAVATDITVDVGARQRVDLTMQVGAVTETVNVVGAAAALEADSIAHGAAQPSDHHDLCGYGAGSDGPSVSGR